MNTIPLPGCTPEPLMSYLKALGVFRLVAEQADPPVRGSWRGGAFVLETKLDRESLTKFFLEQYKPTPILAPWGRDQVSTPGRANLPLAKRSTRFATRRLRGSPSSGTLSRPSEVSWPASGSR